MRAFKRWLKKLFCKHPSKWLDRTDQVLDIYRCDDCERMIVEPHNGFKILRQYERK